MRALTTLRFLLVGITLLTCTTIAFAQQDDGRVVFATDFDELPAGLVVLNDDLRPVSPEIVSGSTDSVVRIRSEQATYLALTSDEEWTNFAVDVTVRVRSGYIGINGRGQLENCDGYMLISDVLRQRLDLFEPDEECELSTRLGGRQLTDVRAGQLFDVRVEFIDLRVNVYVNGAPAFNATLASVESGVPYLFLMPSIRGGFSDIDISALQYTLLSPSRGTGGRSGGSDTPSSATTPELTRYDGTPQEVIDELVAQDLIPDRGSLLFREDYAYFFGQGNWFTPLASRSPRRDVVMAGELTFTYGRSSDLQICGLMTSVLTDDEGTADRLLNFGVNSDGNIFMIGLDGVSRSNFYEQPARFRSGDSRHFVLVLVGGNATLFVDGELVFLREKGVQQEGSFGINLRGTSAEAGCEGRDIWVWDLD